MCLCLCVCVRKQIVKSSPAVCGVLIAPPPVACKQKHTHTHTPPTEWPHVTQQLCQQEQIIIFFYEDCNKTHELEEMKLSVSAVDVCIMWCCVVHNKRNATKAKKRYHVMQEGEQPAPGGERDGEGRSGWTDQVHPGKTGLTRIWRKKHKHRQQQGRSITTQAMAEPEVTWVTTQIQFASKVALSSN